MRSGLSAGLSNLLAVCLFFLPHPFNSYVRRLFGCRISRSAKIGIFSYISTSKLDIGDEAYIAPFSVIKCHSLTLGKFAYVSSFAIILAPIIADADFHLGDHSRVFPFCWIEPGEGVFIGDHVGIGGHSLIFTHGSWSDFLHGGPVAYGPVKIDDHVWLPWRVFVMPNVTIGKRSIVGANSVVTSDIPPNCLAAGMPAKVKNKMVNVELSDEDFKYRVNIIFKEYEKYCLRAGRGVCLHSLEEKVCFFRSHKNETPSVRSTMQIDMSTYSFVGGADFIQKDFLQFLRRYGIRLEKKKLA